MTSPSITAPFAMAMLLATVGGALFAFYGEKFAGQFFDWLAAMWKGPANQVLTTVNAVVG